MLHGAPAPGPFPETAENGKKPEKSRYFGSGKSGTELEITVYL